MEFAMTGSWFANTECGSDKLCPKRSEASGHDCHAGDDECQLQASWDDYTNGDLATHLRTTRIWLDSAIEFGYSVTAFRDHRFPQATGKLPYGTPPYEHISHTSHIPGTQGRRVRSAACLEIGRIRKRLMQEFWNVFNGDTKSKIITAASSTSSTSRSTTGSSSALVAGAVGFSRKRMTKDETKISSMGEGNERLKRPKTLSATPANPQNFNFACPYRKHNPAKYGLQSSRVACALSPWQNVSRVKEHLYRSHRAPPYCERCYLQFDTPADLTSHIRDSSPVCDTKLGEPPEGITVEVERTLKRRKKSFPGQTEEERWKEIYRILFPEDIVPSPYFEPVQDAAAEASDLFRLNDFDEYSRRELPRLVQSILDSELGNDRHVHETRITGIFRDCLDRLLSEYRSQLPANPETTSTITAITSTPTDSTSIAYSSTFDHPQTDQLPCYSPSSIPEPTELDFPSQSWYLATDEFAFSGMDTVLSSLNHLPGDEHLN